MTNTPDEPNILPTPRFGWCLLHVADVAAAADFYEASLGLGVKMRHPSGDYLEFDTGSTTLSLCHTSLLPDGVETTPSAFFTLVFDDVDGAHERACAGGARSLAAPADKPWGQRAATVVDGDGHHIELATEVG